MIVPGGWESDHFVPRGLSFARAFPSTVPTGKDGNQTKTRVEPDEDHVQGWHDAPSRDRPRRGASATAVAKTVATSPRTRSRDVSAVAVRGTDVQSRRKARRNRCAHEERGLPARRGLDRGTHGRAVGSHSSYEHLRVLSHGEGGHPVDAAWRGDHQHRLHRGPLWNVRRSPRRSRPRTRSSRQAWTPTSSSGEVLTLLAGETTAGGIPRRGPRLAPDWSVDRVLVVSEGRGPMCSRMEIVGGSASRALMWTPT